MTGNYWSRACHVFLLAAMLPGAVIASQQVGEISLDDAYARPVVTIDSDILDVDAADPSLLWLAGESGAIRLASSRIAATGGNVSWALPAGPDWLHLDPDGLLQFSAPMQASGGIFAVQSVDGYGTVTGEYAIRYAVRQGQVVAASTAGERGGELWHPNGFFGLRAPLGALSAETDLRIVQFGSGQDRIVTRLHVAPGIGAVKKPFALIFPDESEAPEADNSTGRHGAEACERMLPVHLTESLDNDGWRIRFCRSATFMRAFFSALPGIDISTALNRVPDGRAEFRLEDFPAERFEIVRQPSAVLASLCGPGLENRNCENRDPVLLIHGLSVGGGFGGGKPVWNDLPALLQGFDSGASRFAVYEFYYRSNARFVDIARDLDIAIRAIHAETGGRKVRLVAHSFGGLVARVWLQNFAQVEPSIAPAESCHGQGDSLVESLLTIGTPHSGIASASVMRNWGRLPKGRDGLGGSTISLCRQLSCWEAGADEARGLAGDLFSEAWSALYGVSETPAESIGRLAEFDIAGPGIPVRSLLSLVSGQGTAAGLFGTVPTSNVYLDGDGLISYQGQRFYPRQSCSDESCRNQPIEKPLESFPVDRSQGLCIQEHVLGSGSFSFPFPGATVPTVGRLMRDYRHTRVIPHAASAIQSSINAGLDFPAFGMERSGIWASTHDAMNQILDWLAPGEAKSVLEVIVRGSGSVRIEALPYPVICSGYCLVPISWPSVTLVPVSAGATKTVSISENCVMLDSRRCRMTFQGWGSALVTFDDADRDKPVIEP